MGNNQSRKTAVRGTPAYDMFTSYGQQSCKFLDKWDKDGLFPKDGSLDMDQVLYLKEGLLNMKSQSRQGEWRAFSCWYGEASERHHKSQVRSLTDIQEKQKAQLANMAAQLSESKDARRKLADQLAKSKDDQMNLADQLAKSKDDQMNLADQLAESKDDQMNLEDQLAKSKDHQMNLEDQLAKSRETREELKVQLADIGAQFADSRAAQWKLEDQLEKSKDAHTKLKDQLARSKDAHRKLKHQLARWKDAYWKLEDQLARSKDAQEKLKAEMAALKTKCDACCPWKSKPSAQELPALWQRVLEGENSPAVSRATWTPGELRDLRNLFPNIQNRPDEFKEALDFIFRFYNPRWGEVNWFLGIVIPQRAVREQLLARAQWPATVPGSEVALMLAKQCLLGAVLGVRPKNINWGQICRCKQKSDETPPDFWKRLKESFEKYSGIPQPVENAPDVMAYAFVQSLQPETLERLKKFGVEWRATSLSDLVNTADFGQYLETQEQKRWELGFEDPVYRMFYDSD